ncbi:redoxin domain-containing protein [Streptomyces sp. CC208A]|uniref:TlpA family protein disulfide reductase n=1 Tax=Streptomyces sp. CC208A TaxID=3044573 RepID=UPI0024A7F229|nr:redoxin domain-containing protein [Streptomyces sp. CC208A]
MPFLAAAVALLTILCLLNLVLTFGVIRKLRLQADQRASAAADELMLPPGSPVPDFTAVTTAGETVTRDTLGETLIGFFSPDCTACAERLPKFVELARELDGDRSVLAVVHAEKGEAAEEIAALAAVGHVVVEPQQGPMGTLFKVEGYPIFALLPGDGPVTATAFDLDRLPLRATSRA